MFSHPLVSAEAAQAIRLPLLGSASTATDASTTASTASASAIAATVYQRFGLPPAAMSPEFEASSRERLATVTELHPGNRADKRSRRNRGAIRALKRSYLRRTQLFASDAGMATAEYAIATLAAVGFAGVLVFLLRSEEVRSFLLTLIRTALALP